MIDLNDLIGKPYITDGRGPDGYDCWGLCVEVCKRNGIILPTINISNLACEANSRILGTKHIIDQETSNGLIWQKLEKPEALSIIVMKHHVGVMLNKLLFIHVRLDSSVCVEDRTSLLWKNKIKGYYKYVS